MFPTNQVLPKLKDLSSGMESYTKMYIDDYQKIEPGMLFLGKDYDIEEIVSIFVEIWKEDDIYSA